MKRAIICDTDPLFAESLKQEIMEAAPDYIQSVDIFVPEKDVDFFASVHLEEPPILFTKQWKKTLRFI